MTTCESPIRRAAAEDIPACAAILADNLMWEKYCRKPEDAEVFFRGEFDRGSDIFVYDDNGFIAGSIVLIHRGMMGEFPYVRALSVHPDRRGNGIGTSLLNYAVEQPLRDARLIFMMVSDFNDDALRLYRRLGFDVVGTIPDYKKAGISEYLLLKRKA